MEWFALWVRNGSLTLEAQEHLQKQSYRNRCRIQTRQGVQELIIPLDRSGSRHIQEIGISLREDWWRVHWKAIESAYAHAAFFSALGPEIKELYEHPIEEPLWNWNMRILKMCQKWLGLEQPIGLTTEFTAPAPSDLRFDIHPKKDLVLNATPYRQLAYERPHSFVAGLSILDLLFNEGPAAYSILMGDH